MFGFACWFVAVRDTFPIDTFCIPIVFGFACWFVTVRDTYPIDTFSITIVFGSALWFNTVGNTFTFDTFSITIVFCFACWFVAVGDTLTINTFSISIVLGFAFVLVTGRMANTGTIPGIECECMWKLMLSIGVIRIVLACTFIMLRLCFKNMSWKNKKLHTNPCIQ